jgi:hypothetical protein
VSRTTRPRRQARKSTDVEALLKHVVQIGHAPGPREVVFVAKGAMPFVADWDWLRVALDEVLGLVLPASVVGQVEKVLRGNRPFGHLPVIVRTGGGFQVREIDLVRSAPPPSRVGTVRRRIRLVVLRERGKRGVTFGVTSPDAPGVFAIGRTRAIAVRRFHEAVAELRTYGLGQRAYADSHTTRPMPRSIGSGKSGIPDLGERVDEFLAEGFGSDSGTPKRWLRQKGARP